MEAPIVSIITRTRNRSRLLRRAAASITGQVGAPSWEWIIVNDAGDRMAVEEIASTAEARFPGQVVTLHLEASKGMEHASNRGLDRARGRYLVIHDDDDSWEPAFLRRMTAWLDHPDHLPFAGVVCHSIRIVESLTNEGVRELDRHPFNSELLEIDFWEMLQMNRYPPISFLFRRELLAETGPFNEDLPVLGDWEFNLRILARKPVGLLPEALANYHHRPPSESGDYANSITEGHDRHRTVEQFLRKQWARENPFGLSREPVGSAASIAGHLHEMKISLQRMKTRLESIPKPAPPQF